MKTDLVILAGIVDPAERNIRHFDVHHFDVERALFSTTACGQGNMSAFSRSDSIGPESGDLYRRYAGWLMAQMRRDGFGDIAEDVVQDTFSKIAFGNLTDEVRHPKAFLIRLARNLIVDHARRAAATKRAGPDNIFFESRLAGSTEQFETVLLKQVMMSLPEPQREAFMLSRFGGLSYEEIGKTCGVSVRTIEWRIARAVEHLSRELRD